MMGKGDETLHIVAETINFRDSGAGKIVPSYSSSILGIEKTFPPTCYPSIVTSSDFLS